MGEIGRGKDAPDAVGRASKIEAELGAIARHGWIVGKGERKMAGGARGSWCRAGVE